MNNYPRPRFECFAVVVNCVFVGVKGDRRRRCIHRSACRIYREIDTCAYPPTRCEPHLPAPSRQRHHTWRGARVCECAAIIWNSAITPPIYVRAGATVRTVIIIISRLFIVVRGDRRQLVAFEQTESSQSNPSRSHCEAFDDCVHCSKRGFIVISITEWVCPMCNRGEPLSTDRWNTTKELSGTYE